MLFQIFMINSLNICENIFFTHFNLNKRDKRNHHFIIQNCFKNEISHVYQLFNHIYTSSECFAFSLSTKSYYFTSSTAKSNDQILSNIGCEELPNL